MVLPSLSALTLPDTREFADARFDQRIAAVLAAAADRQQAGVPMTRVVVLSRQLFPVFRARPKPRPRKTKTPNQ